MDRFPADLARLSPSPWTAPYWAAAREHRLVIGRCATCGAVRMPPGPFCWSCHAQPIEWIDGGNTGVVHTFTVTRQAFHHSLKDHVPYVLAVIQLDEVPEARLITNLVGGNPDEVRIGQAVAVLWDDVDEGTTVPRFSIVSA